MPQRGALAELTQEGEPLLVNSNALNLYWRMEVRKYQRFEGSGRWILIKS